MERVLHFLRELNLNNNREWFNAHKSEYLEAKRVFDTFALGLCEGIRGFDSSIGPLGLNDITYRIYRDVRFSRDKSPYKCHMGVFVSPEGRRAGFCGYYFQVSAADRGGWEGSHIVAAGDYMTEPQVLKIIREDIDLGGGDFRAVCNKADSRFSLDRDNSLKNVPKGFSADSPEAEFLKLKHFSLSFYPDDEFVTSSDLQDRLISMFRTTAPFVEYINRAIRYSREEK